MRVLLISARAEADLREIWRFSYERFGEAQADCYVDELEKGLRECGAEPEQGKPREDVRPGYWSRLVRKHVVFYTFSDPEILVQRVLHGSMDPTLHLPGDESEI
jgi:toxin ParE1/3/4